MEHKPAVYALERLHAELGGKIKQNKLEAQRLAKDMLHVEAVMKMLEPDYNLRAIAAKRRNGANPLFKKGEITRTLFSVLREAPAPLTGREIVRELYRRKGVENPTQAQIRHLLGGVNSSLRNYRGKSVERIGEGMPGRWSLIAQ